jgi:hypothetical protein
VLTIEKQPTSKARVTSDLYHLDKQFHVVTGHVLHDEGSIRRRCKNISLPHITTDFLYAVLVPNIS